MEPTATRERIVLLDVLRGFAVFGMFTVNMTADLPWGSALREQPLDRADSTVMILIDLLTNGKFITIFSFLFGVGFFFSWNGPGIEERRSSPPTCGDWQRYSPSALWRLLPGSVRVS